MAVDRDHEALSSYPGIVIGDQPPEFIVKKFIAMEPLRHDSQCKGITPAVSPASLATMEPMIRQRIASIMDELPIGEEFDWVDKVSIELTTQMLATLFDFPFEDQSKLICWPDIATSSPDIARDHSVTAEERMAALTQCLETLPVIWNERANKTPSKTCDFITLIAHSPAFKDMDPMEYLGNLILLIVGGNDNARNSITGGVLELNNEPAEFAKLKADHILISNRVSEIIRYQTPLMRMRRLATRTPFLAANKFAKATR